MNGVQSFSHYNQGASESQVCYDLWRAERARLREGLRRENSSEEAGRFAYGSFQTKRIANVECGRAGSGLGARPRIPQ